ncbi:AAA family ATPase [Streptomyces sp. NBC_00879]|uniref:ATP-binding protein n=1 Tax=Streptomyces sp. NBC_00879 TaxID=2975855 RepID=UPI0038666A34|nr:AAA family ATPase [Streptomyces sp. NBC_00879]
MRSADVVNNSGLVVAGREHELDRLLAGLRQLPAVVFIEGEAGIGKTHLIHEAVSVQGDEEVRIAWGSCHPLRDPFPYHALAETLRSLYELLPNGASRSPTGHVLTPLLPELASCLPRNDSGPRPASTTQLLAAVHSLIESVSPVVMVVEDLHWADEASRELLLLLARNMPPNAGLVLSYRNEELPSRDAVLGTAYGRPPGVGGLDLHLGPLDEAAVHRLAAEVLGHELPREVSRLLHRRSDGLPRVVMGDLAALRARGSGALITNSQSAQAVIDDLEVPRGFIEAFTARVRRLPPDGISILQAAAVLGVQFEQTLVTEVAALSPDRGGEGLLAALAADVLHETAPMTYAYRRALGRRAVYESLPGPVRLRLHRQALRVLWRCPKPPLAEIARQTRLVGDTEAWIGQAITAADQAIALGDTATAVSILYEILAAPGANPDQLAHAALMLARVAFDCTQPRTMINVLRRVLTAPALPITSQGEIRMHLALLTVDHCGERGGYRELVQSVDELQSRPELVARATSALALGEVSQSEEEARNWLDLAEKAAMRSADIGAEAYVRTARLTLSAIRAEGEAWDAAEQLPRQTRDPHVAAATNRTLHNVGDVAVRLGHDERARRLLSDSMGMASFRANALLECYSTASLLQLDWWAGEWNALERRLSDLCEEHPEMAVSRATRSVVTGCLALTRGEQVRALRHLRTASEKGEGYVALWAKAVIARTQLADGEAEAAWSLTARALKEFGNDHQWWQACGLVPVAVQAALACGRADAADRVLAKAERIVEGQDVPAANAELREARGHFQRKRDPARAAAEFERARALWQAIGRPYQVAQAAERQAEALVTAGSPGLAGTHLRTAIETYSRLGATFDVSRCDWLLREAGQMSTRPRGRRSYGNRLSPRELEVAHLVAGGASNRDIARVLFLSPRTVEHHVTKVLRKLDVSRRHDVAQALPNSEQ